MVNPQLLEYVRQQLSVGVSKEDIAKSLIAAGWRVSDINEALNPNTAAPPPPFAPPQSPNPAVAVAVAAASNNQMGSSQALAPIGQLFSGFFALYRQHFVTLLVLFAIPSIIGGIGSLLVGTNFLLSFLLSILVYWLLFPAASAGAVYALSKGEGTAQSLRAGLSLLFPTLWFSILGFFIVMGGYFMLLIPGILMSIWFSFGFITLVVEGKRGISALLQSREYVRGYWWAVWVRLILFALFGILFIIPLALLLAILTFPLWSLGQTVVATIAKMVISVFINSLSFTYLYKMYQNLAALKPSLPASQQTSGRGFLITSGAVGIIGLILVIVGFFYLSAYLLQANLDKLNTNLPATTQQSSTASSTDQLTQNGSATNSTGFTTRKTITVNKGVVASGSTFQISAVEYPRDAVSWSLRIDCPIGVTVDIQKTTSSNSPIGSVMHCNEDIPLDNELFPTDSPTSLSVSFRVKIINPTRINQSISIVSESFDVFKNRLNQSTVPVTVQPQK